MIIRYLKAVYYSFIILYSFVGITAFSWGLVLCELSHCSFLEVLISQVNIAELGCHTKSLPTAMDVT